jgi:cysteine desulfurase
MIYLDNNATTPIDPRVAEAMLPYLQKQYGNPSSSHPLGREAKKAVEMARGQVANLLGCMSDEIVFTSGGSESNNMAIKGVARSYREHGNHIITSVIEHPSVLNPCKSLEADGFRVTLLPVDAHGVVQTCVLEEMITEATILVSVMLANNETGTLQPLKEISRICRRHGVLLHTDAAQAVGKIPVQVHDLGIDLLTVAGHKMYAPKGIGALYVREGVQVEPLVHGAGHEHGLRAGTENVIFDVALGKACELAMESCRDNSVKALTNYFFKGLQDIFGEHVKLNGEPEMRLPNTLNVSFLGHLGMDVLSWLGDDIAASTGSACHVGLESMSPVLRAMGVSEETGRGAIRFSLGRMTTKDEIAQVLQRLSQLSVH